MINLLLLLKYGIKSRYIKNKYIEGKLVYCGKNIKLTL